MSRRRVARLDDLAAGQPSLVETDGTQVVLSRVDDDVFAVSAECPHQGGPLKEGRLAGTRLTCPWHGWMFDLKSGTCLMPSRGGPVVTYPVTIEAGEVWIEVS
ncbi:MAG: Rieske (2Fe-2S) protein [Gammaproteobacteria bacterium]